MLWDHSECPFWGGRTGSSAPGRGTVGAHVSGSTSSDLEPDAAPGSQFFSGARAAPHSGKVDGEVAVHWEAPGPRGSVPSLPSRAPALEKAARLISSAGP